MATTQTRTESKTNKKSVTTNTIAQLNELKRLKKEIVSTFENTTALVKSSKDKARQALAEAILCGKALKAAKEIIGYGGFTRWLKENCKAIADRTARQYMLLSERHHNANLSATTLRKAYIELGIVTEDVESETSAPVESRAESRPLPTTPAASAANKSHAATTKPAISLADALSRPKFLTDELLLVLNNTINNKSASLASLEAATLTPLKSWFDAQRKGKRK